MKNGLNHALFILLFLFFYTGNIAAQQTGPVLVPYGATYDIADPDFPTDTGHIYQVVFDIALAPDDPGELNRRINTLARFLNMHVRAGVPRKNLRVAAVFHGTGIFSILNSAAYRERYKIENPNLPLLEKLGKAGVNLYVCGQSLHAREVAREEVTKTVGVALSAMTVLIQLQNKGYALVDW